MSTALKITEKQWQQKIIDAARVLGWKVFHPWTSIHSTSGYPDVTCVHPEYGVVWFECKSETGKVTPEQAEWIRLLQASGHIADVVRPSDWPLVQDILRGAVRGAVDA